MNTSHSHIYRISIYTLLFVVVYSMCAFHRVDAESTQFRTDISSRIRLLNPVSSFLSTVRNSIGAYTQKTTPIINSLFTTHSSSGVSVSPLAHAQVAVDQVISPSITGRANTNPIGTPGQVPNVISGTPVEVPPRISIDPSRLIAQSVLVKNLSTNQIVYERNADDVLPLASLTKLMTALTVREMQQTWKTVPAEIELTSDTVAQTRVDIAVRGGGYMNTNDVLNYMLLTSSNFAADSLANNIIPESSFISFMNHLGRKIGLQKTVFTNASGLTDIAPRTRKPVFSVGTAKDVTIILEKIIKESPDLAYATQVPEAVITTNDGTRVEIKNTNKLLDDPLFQTPQKRLVLGKTGFTDEAGGNLAIVLLKNDQYYSITVLGSTLQGRFDDIVYLATQI